MKYNPEERKQRPVRGFTFIEILVAIAIVVILAALVMLSFRQLRIKARNAAIKEDVDQMRVVAENVFDENVGAGYCGPGLKCATTDPRMVPLKKDFDDQNGGAGGEPTLVSGDNFCVFGVLADEKTYCADSRGKYSGTSLGNGTGQCLGGRCN